MKRISDKRKAKLAEERILREEMWRIFRELWRKRGPFSEISGIYLGKEPLSTLFHHILPKSKYRGAMLDDENIIMVSFEEHQKVESNPHIFEEVNKRREILLEKYE